MSDKTLEDYMDEARHDMEETMRMLEAKHERLRRRNRIWLLYPALFLLALWVVGKITLMIVM